MRLYYEVRALLDWWRALRSLYRILGQVTVLVLLFTSAACAGDDPPTAASFSARATVRLANAGQHGIWFVRSRRCGSSQWSQDRLEAEVIAAGMTRTISFAPGCMDLRLETTSALGGFRQWDSLDLQAGQALPLMLEEWTFTPALDGEAPPAPGLPTLTRSRG